MRLVCPKCEAQYNVADDAIPQGGRDVQCSNCSYTWFQPERRPPLSREVSRILSKPIPSVQKTQSRETSGYDTPQTGRANNSGPMHEPVGDGPRRRPVDPAVADILREEAARAKSVTDYSAVRKPATRDAKPEVAEETRKRIAAMTADEDGTTSSARPASAAAAGAAAKANPRAIPDMTEINAALRARADTVGEGGLTELEKHEAERKRGFLRGFLIVLILFGLIVAPYIYADRLLAYMPELQGYIVTYVAVIDQLRLTLDTLVKAAIAVVKSYTG